MDKWYGENGEIKDQSEVLSRLRAQGLIAGEEGSKSSAGRQATATPSGASESSSDTERFINTVYQNTLGRAPDESGMQYWQGEMANGMSREGVYDNIRSGAEYQSNLRSANHGSATLVQDRLQGLLEDGSKYLDLARTSARQSANDRGLLNSSMAAGAGEQAAISAALGIAQQDAQALTNTSMQNAQQDNAMKSQLLDNLYQQDLIDTKAFANLHGQYADSFVSMINEANINISEIQANANIPAAEKAKMIDQQIEMRNADLEAMQALFENMPMWEQNWNAL